MLGHHWESAEGKIIGPNARIVIGPNATIDIGPNTEIVDLRGGARTEEEPGQR